MSGEPNKRPWLAAFLAIAAPGLGHVYLRAWFRALLWFWLIVISFVLFVPPELIDGVASFSDAMALSSELPTEAEIALFVVISFSALDAYWQANRSKRRTRGQRCPHCGHEIDDIDLEFCHWCTEPLPDRRDEEPTSR